MNGRFYFLGAIISLVLHGAFLCLLSVGSCATSVSEKEGPADTSPAFVETNVVPPAAVPPAAVSPVVAQLAEPVRTRETAMPPPTTTASPEPAETEREWKTYVVKKGDTLTLLSKKAGCSVSEIAKRNKKTVAQMAKLWVGQKIRLPAE